MSTKAPLAAPFLKRISLLPEKTDRETFPFARFPDLLADDFSLEFPKAVTLFVGENGTGKSTILQAIAKLCGFATGGGDINHQLHYTADATDTTLAKAIRPSWLPKVSRGFFFRADTFADVARYIDDEGSPSAPGGKLGHRSHGESLMDVFSNRFGTSERCMYLLDEPENALSPMRQLEFLRLLRFWENSGNAQIIIATHSPILMSYPGADILEFNDQAIEPISFDDIQHVQVLRGYLANPERYLKALFDDE